MEPEFALCLTGSSHKMPCSGFGERGGGWDSTSESHLLIKAFYNPFKHTCSCNMQNTVLHVYADVHVLYALANTKVRLQPDPFLSELTNMFERTTEKGSVWVTLKHSSDKSKVQRNKMTTAGEKIEFKCLVRATDGKKTIATVVGPKDHQRFQSSYATILKARMTALKKRERKDKKKAADSDKKQDQKKQPKPSS
ncbi:Signal recognition particle [Perilla frutescens var. hirtella]|uniref:Signal recognition particle 14 kDa protein n=1 Tax=Perilla frutescens var. hirtella TaxID=608512 RepID=A0AAD4JJI7_PERFH|nr:Signal recognition particle [Perilla frutescens var. hirtella]KAH6834932.1 Signal recognition particle [Perilla frutescens var. hirtella]